MIAAGVVVGVAVAVAQRWIKGPKPKKEPMPYRRRR